MTSLEDVERDFAKLWRAIAELSAEDLARLRARLEAFEERQLAEAIERDARLQQERQAGQARSRGRGRRLQGRRRPQAVRQAAGRP